MIAHEAGTEDGENRLDADLYGFRRDVPVAIGGGFLIASDRSP